MGLFDLFRKKAPAQAQPDPRALFSAEVQALAHEVPGITQVVPAANDFSLTLTVHGQESSVYLGNLFQETREVSPEERTERIRWFLKAMAAPKLEELSWEEARPRLRCALRAPIHMAQFMEAKTAQLAREVLPCLREHVVIDSEASMAFATEETLQRWGKDRDEVFEAAEQNLAKVAMVGVELYSQTPDRIFSVESNDTYESSRLLVPGFLAAFRSKVNGRPIAVVPERATLLISGDARAETVLWMCEKAEREYAASMRSVSAAVYTVDDAGKVIPYVRLVKDDAARKVREAHTTFVGTEYAQQKKMLEAHYEERGIDVFVASFSGLRSPEGDLVSYCTWSQGVDGLLPRTDEVVVFLTESPEDGFVRVRWEDALRIGGGALRQEPGMFPPRWRATRVLTPAELKQLQAVRVA